jgi:hypothetical protein
MRRQGGVTGWLLHHGKVSFQGGHPPQQVMEVEVEGNVCWGWLHSKVKGDGGIGN